MAALPNLKAANWLSAPETQAVFAALEQAGDEARIVGGAVRNALFGLPVADVDFATTALPAVVTERATAAGLKTVPTGIEHGTVTVLVGGRSFEVTTLREDVDTDGRHAVVRFGRDWRADALRRDFTVNALSVTATGEVHDPLGGYDDVIARRIRFIGDADRRIAEDRLRILRFFRLYAEYGDGELDRDGLSASIRAREELRDLSAERVGQEIRRLMRAPGAAVTAAAMQDGGILPIVFGGVGYVASLARLVAAEAALGLNANGVLRLAALACRIDEDVLRLANCLRLSNAERDGMLAALAAVPALSASQEERAARHVLYRHGENTYRNAVLLALVLKAAAPDDADWHGLYRLPERWHAPIFPLGGRDVIAETGLRGPAVGAALKSLEGWWVENDFAADEAALRKRLMAVAIK